MNIYWIAKIMVFHLVNIMNLIGRPYKFQNIIPQFTTTCLLPKVHYGLETEFCLEGAMQPIEDSLGGKIGKAGRQHKYIAKQKHLN